MNMVCLVGRCVAHKNQTGQPLAPTRREHRPARYMLAQVLACFDTGTRHHTIIPIMWFFTSFKTAEHAGYVFAPGNVIEVVGSIYGKPGKLVVRVDRARVLEWEPEVGRKHQELFGTKALEMLVDEKEDCDESDS